MNTPHSLRIMCIAPTAPSNSETFEWLSFCPVLALWREWVDPAVVEERPLRSTCHHRNPGGERYRWVQRAVTFWVFCHHRWLRLSHFFPMLGFAHSRWSYHEFYSETPPESARRSVVLEGLSGGKDIGLSPSAQTWDVAFRQHLWKECASNHREPIVMYQTDEKEGVVTSPWPNTYMFSRLNLSGLLLSDLQRNIIQDECTRMMKRKIVFDTDTVSSQVRVSKRIEPTKVCNHHMHKFYSLHEETRISVVAISVSSKIISLSSSSSRHREMNLWIFMFLKS